MKLWDLVMRNANGSEFNYDVCDDNEWNVYAFQELKENDEIMGRRVVSFGISGFEDNTIYVTLF